MKNAKEQTQRVMDTGTESDANRVQVPIGWYLFKTLISRFDILV
jgi:hypothetical protein